MQCLALVLGDQLGVADVRLGNADLDLCGVWGHLGAGRRSGAQWAAARPQSQIMVTSILDVSNV